ILLTEETPIRTIQFWDVAEHFLVAFEGRFHVLFIVRVALEHFVLRDQPLDTFGKKNFVAELQRCLHLAALDLVGVGFKDGIDLFGFGNLLSLVYATEGWIVYTVSRLTLVHALLQEYRDVVF